MLWSASYEIRHFPATFNTSQSSRKRAIRKFGSSIGTADLRIRAPLLEGSTDGSTYNVDKAAAVGIVDHTVYYLWVIIFWDPRSHHPREITTIQGGGRLHVVHTPKQYCGYRHAAGKSRNFMTGGSVIQGGEGGRYRIPYSTVHHVCSERG